jgi:hypothetical protein
MERTFVLLCPPQSAAVSVRDWSTATVQVVRVVVPSTTSVGGLLAARVVPLSLGWVTKHPATIPTPSPTTPAERPHLLLALNNSSSSSSSSDAEAVLRPALVGPVVMRLRDLAMLAILSTCSNQALARDVGFIRTVVAKLAAAGRLESPVAAAFLLARVAAIATHSVDREEVNALLQRLTQWTASIARWGAPAGAATSAGPARTTSPPPPPRSPRAGAGSSAIHHPPVASTFVARVAMPTWRGVSMASLGFVIHAADDLLLTARRCGAAMPLRDACRALLISPLEYASLAFVAAENPLWSWPLHSTSPERARMPDATMSVKAWLFDARQTAAAIELALLQRREALTGSAAGGAPSTDTVQGTTKQGLLPLPSHQPSAPHGKALQHPLVREVLNVYTRSTKPPIVLVLPQHIAELLPSFDRMVLDVAPFALMEPPDDRHAWESWDGGIAMGHNGPMGVPSSSFGTTAAVNDDVLSMPSSDGDDGGTDVYRMLMMRSSRGSAAPVVQRWL